MAGQTSDVAHNADDQVHFKQRRARSQLSCAQCRQGKLKCNRSHPACDQCIKRSRESNCQYVPPAVKSRSNHNVKGRIRHLEQLVIELMNSKDSPNQDDPSCLRSTSVDSGLGDRGSMNTAVVNTEPTPPLELDSGLLMNDIPQGVRSDTSLGGFGHMNISKNETSYVGESHWAAILDSISDLKRDVDDGNDLDHGVDIETDQWHGEDAGDSETDDPEAVSFLLRSPRRLTKSELLRSLPSKLVVDRLVSLWFNSADPIKLLVHPPTFQDEYRRFWQDQRKAPTMWLGLLFAILRLASSIALRDECDYSSPAVQTALAQSNQYHELAAAAAVLADYTTPKTYTLECLMLYTSGMQSRNSFVDVWLCLGMIARLALRMGYHRDPSHWNTISPFRGEYRRRTWHVIYMMDVFISFQLGLPSTIRSIQSDTKPPSNLFDHDFGPHSLALPPSRPLDEHTPVSYGIVKVGICVVFAKAAEMSHATVPPSYTQILELDRELETARSRMPPALRIRPLDECVTITPELIMCRFNLDLLYLKTRCVLHRRFMKIDGADAGMSYSRQVAIECAMQTLRHHHEIYVASQPGGQLEVVRWYMGSISTNDFLLAAVVICLELGQQSHSTSAELTSGYPITYPSRQDMVDAIARSKQIWDETTRAVPEGLRPALSHGTYREAHVPSGTAQASKALAVMLARVAKSQATINAVLVDSGPGILSTHLHGSTSPPISKGPLVTAGNDGVNIDTSTSFNDFSMIGDMLDPTQIIDWEIWDQQIAGQHDLNNLPDWSMEGLMESAQPPYNTS